MVGSWFSGLFPVSILELLLLVMAGVALWLSFYLIERK